MKLFGLTIDNKLIYDIHINDLRKMASAKRKGVKRIRNTRPNVKKNWQRFNLAMVEKVPSPFDNPGIY